MDKFDNELEYRIRSIEKKDLQIEIKKLFIGKKEFKDEIDELKNKEDFKAFLNNWEYRSKIIYDANLWKNQSSNFFHLDNSYFLLKTENDLLVFKQFLEKECIEKIQENQNRFSESNIIKIYEEYLMELNPTYDKQKVINALKDVLTKKIEASYDNIYFLTKELLINTSKPIWYSILDLSNDQVSIVSKKIKFCERFKKHKDIINNLAVNKFKLISNNNLSENNQRKILEELQKNPDMTKNEIESLVNQYNICTCDDVERILNQLKSLWNKLDKKTKKNVSFQLYKIKEKIK